MIGVGVGGVEFSVGGHGVGFAVEAVRGIALKVVARAAEVAEVTVEAAVDGIAVEVPLADGERGVARAAHGLAHGDALFDPQADVLPILPAHERGAGRLALGGVVELGEAQTVGREAIEVRRLNLTAVTAEVGKAQIVGEDEDDVWTRRGREGAPEMGTDSAGDEDEEEGGEFFHRVDQFSEALFLDFF